MNSEMQNACRSEGGELCDNLWGKLELVRYAVNHNKIRNEWVRCCNYIANQADDWGHNYKNELMDGIIMK